MPILPRGKFFKKRKRFQINKSQEIAQENLLYDDELTSSDSGSDEWFSGNSDNSKTYSKGNYLEVNIGDVLNNKYIIEKKLGWGHFSMVYLANNKELPDDDPNKKVALKIQKCSKSYQESAEDEIKILKKVQDTSNNCKYITQILDWFSVYNLDKHYVMVLNVLSKDLYSLMDEYRYLPIGFVKKIAKEVLMGLNILHENSGIIVTDIKPENLLLSRYKSYSLEELKLVKQNSIRRKYEKELKKSKKMLKNKLNKNKRKKTKKKINKIETILNEIPNYYEIDDDNELIEIAKTLYDNVINDKDTIHTVITDLGTSCFSNKINNSILGTRHYQSPESVIGMNWSHPTDIWSSACTFLELITGEYFFDPHCDDEQTNIDIFHLYLMFLACGKFPKKITETSNASQFFNRKGYIKGFDNNYIGFRNFMKEYCEELDLLDEEFELLLDFFSKMIKLNPDERYKASQLINHKWLDITDRDKENCTKWMHRKIYSPCSSNSSNLSDSSYYSNSDKNDNTEDNDTEDNDTEDNDTEDNDTVDNDTVDNDTVDNDTVDDDTVDDDTVDNDTVDDDTVDDDTVDDDTEDDDTEDDDTEDDDTEEYEDDTVEEEEYEDDERRI